MKKNFISIILALIIITCCIGWVGCNNGFELVKSITITTNGETKTFCSSVKPSFSLIWFGAEITEDEYNNAPKDRILNSGNDKLEKLSKITVNEAIKASKNATYYELVEKELQGDWYRSNFDFYGGQKYHYFKGRYDRTYFNFVYAKVKNDTTIAIRKGDTEGILPEIKMQIKQWRNLP